MAGEALRRLSFAICALNLSKALMLTGMNTLTATGRGGGIQSKDLTMIMIGLRRKKNKKENKEEKTE